MVSAKRENAKEVDRLNKDIQEGIIKNIQEQLADDDINFTGDLSNSFMAGMDSNGFHTVESDNEYAGFVEFGMPAGEYVDYNKLRIWVEGKLGIPEGDELTAVTWNILRKIRNQGIPQKRFMKKAIRKFIGEHGKTTPRRGKAKKGGKGFKRARKALKTLRKLIKKFKSMKRKMKKVTKPVTKMARKYR